MNVSLTPELEREIERRVASGRYTSASEVIREALRLFLRFEAARAAEIDDVHQRIAAGIAQLDRGEGVPAEQARDVTNRRIAARRARAAR